MLILAVSGTQVKEDNKYIIKKIIFVLTKINVEYNKKKLFIIELHRYYYIPMILVKLWDTPVSLYPYLYNSTGYAGKHSAY